MWLLAGLKAHNTTVSTLLGRAFARRVGGHDLEVVFYPLLQVRQRDLAFDRRVRLGISFLMPPFIPPLLAVEGTSTNYYTANPTH
jgi:hypothetical protein